MKPNLTTNTHQVDIAAQDSARGTPAEDSQAAQWLGPEGPLASLLPYYEHRETQMQMASAVECSIANSRICLIEAGTGIGKTLAYLCAALSSGKRVVIATSTRALQDQIMHHDIPLLQRSIKPFSAVCIKGLNNYLCLRRYQSFMESGASLNPQWANAINALKAWKQETDLGDRQELKVLPEDHPIWAQVSSSSDTRIGHGCPFFEPCFTSKLRQHAQKADVIITNHHLFFADLAVRDAHLAQVLPDYDAVIFDEAHRIEDNATTFFGARISSLQLSRLVKDAHNQLPPQVLSQAKPMLTALDAISADLGHMGTRNQSQSNDEKRLLLDTHEAHDFLQPLGDALQALRGALKQLSRHPSALERRVQSLHDTATNMLAVEHDVFWLHRHSKAVTLGWSPVNIEHKLRHALFESRRGIVLTSATLSVDGRFDHIVQRLGIDESAIAEKKSLASSFDFSTQSCLYIPHHLPLPQHPSFAQQAIEQIRELVQLSDGGALILCTSYRRCDAIAKQCKEWQWPVWTPKQAPTQSMLDAFKQHGRGILIATTGFWEGIDVQGHALRLVIIDKLPFQVPSDPLIEARCQAINDQGGSAFRDYLLPQTALFLKQGFGRLIRSQQDTGIVSILDARIIKKSYGKVLLRSLPKAYRATTLDEVKRFWELKLKSCDANLME